MSEERSYGPRECGSCRLWKPILEDERGPIGPCRLQVRTGHFPGTAPTCERYLSRDAAIPSAPPPEPSRRRATRPAGPVVRRSGPEHEIRRGGPEPEMRRSGPEHEIRRGGSEPQLHRGEPDATSQTTFSLAEAGPSPDRGAEPMPEELTAMTREEFAQAIREALRDDGSPVRLAPRWEGGTVVLKPGDAETQAKEIPLDSLFHKIVMIRDRLRVLEQRINAHEKLTDAEKVEMQQYVTRCYGSLTTFNLLFRDDREKFTGEKT